MNEILCVVEAQYFKKIAPIHRKASTLFVMLKVKLKKEM
jgi:hypothetical protein